MTIHWLAQFESPMPDIDESLAFLSLAGAVVGLSLPAFGPSWAGNPQVWESCRPQRRRTVWTLSLLPSLRGLINLHFLRRGRFAL